MVTVEIRVPRNRVRLEEVEEYLGSNRLYRKGTDESHYANFLERSQADLAVVNLNSMPGVKARVLDGSPDPPISR